jgi:hypothetical protein
MLFFRPMRLSADTPMPYITISQTPHVVTLMLMFTPSPFLFFFSPEASHEPLRHY